MASNRRNQGAQASSSDPSSAIFLPPSEEIGPPDQFSKVRRLPLFREEAIPRPPSEFVPFSVDESAGLRTFPEDMQAESVNVVGEVAARGDQVPKDLGPLCPGADKATMLLGRVNNTNRALRRAQAVVEYLQAQDRINRHDVFSFVNQVKAAYSYHLPFNAQLDELYPTVSYMIEAQGSKIVDGRIRARKVRDLAEKLEGAQKVIQDAGLMVEKKSGSGEGSSEE